MCDKSNADNFVTVSSESLDKAEILCEFKNIVRDRPKSSVWKYFEKRNSDTIQCTVCLKELKVKQSNHIPYTSFKKST